MYNPCKYRITDLSIIEALIRAYPPGTNTSNAANYPLASPIPMIVDLQEEGLRLTGHMARNNPHTELLSHQTKVLVTFQGASAYVSSYAKDPEQLSILPTWNYMVAHLYGELAFVSDEALPHLMQEMLDHLEAPYPRQVEMDKQNQQALAAKFKAIAGFRIQVLSVRLLSMFSVVK